MIRLAEDGAGLVAVPKVLVREQVRTGRLLLIKTDLDVPALEFTCTYPVNPNNPRAQLIDRLAQDVVKKHRA